MSDTPEETPTDAPVDAPVDAPDGPEGPFIVRGSDGSERGPYATLEAAQEAQRQLADNHGEGFSFAISHAVTGEPA